MNEMKMIRLKWLGYALMLTVLALTAACQAHTSIPLEDTALIIMREDSGLINLSRVSGSIIASGEHAWRYQDDQLIEIELGEYENALNSSDRNDWPPYTITFSVSPPSEDKSIQVDVSIFYDRGITEDSRGGNSSTWKLKYQERRWQVISIVEGRFWD